MDIEFELSETKEHGCELKICDSVFADELDDFLAEKCYVLFDMRDGDGCIYFDFGQASCVEKVRHFVELFLKSL